MSNRKMIPIVLALIFLASCAQQPITPTKDLATVVAEGTLAKASETTSSDSDYEWVTAEVGSIDRNAELAVSIETPISRDLFFERDNGRLVGLYATAGQRVAKDEVLAEITFDLEQLESERRQLVLRMDQFERGAVVDEAQHLQNIQNAWNEAEVADEIDLELKMLAYSKLELGYEQFLYNNTVTRENYREQLEELDEKLAGEQILAPFDGIVTYTFTNKVGTLIRNWYRVVNVVDDTKIQFSVQGARDVVRYGDTFNIKDKSGKIDFDARVVSDPVAMFTTEPNHKYMLEPVDPDVIQSITDNGNVQLSTISRLILTATPQAVFAAETVVIPRRAIRPEDKKNYVYIFEDGIVKKRYIKMGLNYADAVQILDGLNPGQRVVLSP